MAVLAAITLVATSCQEGGNQSDARTIVIASDGPISAELDARDAEQAIGFAIKRQGVISGFKLVYWPLDDSLGGNQNPFRGRENIDRAAADSRVLGVVGPWTTSMSLVELPEANPAPLAMVSPSATGSCLTTFDPPCTVTANDLRPSGEVNFFRIAASDRANGAAMGRFAAKRGLKRVAAFNELGVTEETYVDGFKDGFAASGGQVVLVETLKRNTKSFTEFLTRARDLHADAVYAVAAGSEFACRAAVQMKTLLPGAAFLGMDGMALDSGCVSDIGAAQAEGITASWADVDPRSSIDPFVKKQVDAFLKSYPRASDVVDYTFAAYDATSILIDAIRRAVEKNGGAFPSRQQVIDALGQTNGFRGVTGTYAFDRNGDAVAPMMAFYQLHNGAWIPVDA